MVSHPSKIVVIGSGVSGMSSAMSAVEGGASVTLISRTVPSRSGSACIREGINACLGGDVSSHVSDTLAVGCGLASQESVEAMCQSAPGIAGLLSNMGVLFDRTQGEGRIREGRTCGASKPMTLYSGRATGARVLSALTGQMLRHEAHGRVRSLFGWEFLSLILDEKGRCCGVVAQDMRNMEIRAFPADSVIMCTGGYQALFGNHCASELSDGYAAMRAFQQGARFANPEFVEMMPFAIPAPAKSRSVVDAVLAEGGRAYMDKDGRPWHFLEEYHSNEKGCVPRSIAFRSVLKAKDALGRKDASVTLDLEHLDPAFIETRLAPFVDACEGIYENVLSAVKVEPSIGLTLGGLDVDIDHATSIVGLYAAGTCCCAYHGAGTLAGNELLSSIHGGMVAGSKAASCEALGAVSQSLVEKSIDAEEDLIARISARDGRENVHEIDTKLGETLFECVALGKENETLARAAGSITELEGRADRAALLDRAEWANGELFFTRRLAGKTVLARMFVDASIAREESRGCHFKPSQPETDDSKWKMMTKASWNDGKVAFDSSDIPSDASSEY